MRQIIVHCDLSELRTMRTIALLHSVTSRKAGLLKFGKVLRRELRKKLQQKGVEFDAFAELLLVDFGEFRKQALSCFKLNANCR